MIYNVGPQFTQWDTGRSVSVSDSDATHIHFANQGDSKAVIIEIINGLAKVPDYLFQTGKNLLAYAVKDGVTLESKSFAVSKRERPENYVYEEDQRNYIYELITSAETAIKEANTAAENANQASANVVEATAGATVATENANVAANNANIAADSANKAAANAAHTAKSLMVVGEAVGEIIALDDAIEQYLVGCRIFGKTTQDGTPTPDAPVELVSVGDDGNIGVTVTGKNLIPPTSITSGFTGNGDGTYTVADLTQNTNTIGAFRLEAGKQYTLSATRISGSGLFPCLIFRKADGTNLKTNYVDTSLPVTVTPTETETIRIILQGTGSKGSCTVGDKFAIQLEVGFAATAYEPYKHQTLTVSTPNGLPGIPVSSGGNYTDANGQQWICDEIDFGRGVYVQRVYEYTCTGNENWATSSLQNEIFVSAGLVRYDAVINGYPNARVTDVLSTHCLYAGVNRFNEESGMSAWVSAEDSSALPARLVMGIKTVEDLKGWLAEQYASGTPVRILYVLKISIETPLSEEELVAYAALHTYKDNTTVSNDAGAWMDLEYVMDAKKYIDSLVTGGIAPARVE